MESEPFIDQPKIATLDRNLVRVFPHGHDKGVYQVLTCVTATFLPLDGHFQKVNNHPPVRHAVGKVRPFNVLGGLQVFV